MKILVYTFLLVLNLGLVSAQEVDDNHLVWVRHPVNLTDSLESRANSMTIDKDSNIYIGGTFSGIKIFEKDTLVTNKGDGFIVKYSPQGSVIWAQQTGGAGVSFINSDTSHNIYVMGSADTVDFGNSISLGPWMQSPYYNPYFIAKYTKEGDVLWAKRIQKSNGGLLNDFTTDADGNMYIGGDFGYIAKYTSNGDRVWDIEAYGSGGGKTGNFLSVDNANNLIAVGRIGGTLYTTKGRTYGFISKYTQEGKILWTDTLVGDSSTINVYSVTTDKNQNICILGEFSRAIDFGNGIIFKNEHYVDTLSKRNFFIAKFDANGTFLWANEIANPTNYGFLNGVRNVDTDDKGYIYVHGRVSDTLDFGDGNIITANQRGSFIAIYNPQGKLLQLRKAFEGSHYTSSYSRVKVDNDNIYISGFYSDTTKFGKDNELISYGQPSMFLAKYLKNITVNITNTELLKTNENLSIHPNPAHSTSRISFKTTAPSHTRLTLTDVLGRQTLLQEETLDAGEHSAEINTANFPAGIYVLTLEAKGQVFSQTVVIER